MGNVQEEYIEGITWDSVIGQHEAKRALVEAVEWPHKHSHLFKHYNKKPSKGVLLYGEPGNGKTMLAKAAANTLQELYSGGSKKLRTESRSVKAPSNPRDTRHDEFMRYYMSQRFRGGPLVPNIPWERDETPPPAPTHKDAFIYVKGPELLNRYVGGSEEMIRDLFKRARAFKQQHKYPAILFIGIVHFKA